MKIPLFCLAGKPLLSLLMFVYPSEMRKKRSRLIWHLFSSPWWQKLLKGKIFPGKVFLLSLFCPDFPSFVILCLVCSRLVEHSEKILIDREPVGFLTEKKNPRETRKTATWPVFQFLRWVLTKCSNGSSITIPNFTRGSLSRFRQLEM